jgi:hypothetical protein
MLLSLLLACSPALLQDDPLGELRAAYHAHYDADDAAQLEELWRAHPDLVLPLLEDDLSKARAAWDLGPTPQQALRIKALEGRALWGARLAASALDRPALADYVAAAVGWDAAGRAAWRARKEQQDAALAQFRAGRFDEAARAAASSQVGAANAGDWWAEASGLTLEGIAHEAAGEPTRALAAVSRARLLNHQLGLIGAEYQNLRGMLSLLTGLEQWSRAREVARGAAVLARALQDTAGLRALLAERLALEERLGDRKAARAVRAELEALGG